MKEIYRHIHFDFHTMPGIDDFNREWDAAAFAQRLAEANVDHINFPAACNLGFSYYKTSVGISYPGMKGDMLRDILKECHARQIGVNAYINVGLMHEQARLHPEWCRIDKEGRLLRGDRVYNNFFRTMCYNSKGYHDYLISVIQEICQYDIDGLFCDCMHFFPCHCTACTEDMLRQGIDIEDENAVKGFSREVMRRVCEEIKTIVGPERYLYFNGMPCYEYRDLDTHIELECLPSGEWGYDYMWLNAAYARTCQDTLIYMTGRFQADWGDFGGYKTKESIENDLYDGLCNNMRLSIGDHMHPAQIQEKDIYRDIGSIYDRLKRYEPYTKNAKFQADIGVLTDCTGFFGGNKTYKGLARMLAELKQDFNVIHTDMDFGNYAVLILPDHLRINKSLAEKLEAYVVAGGKLLFTGSSGLLENGTEFALPQIQASYEGKDTSNSSYFTFVTVPEGSASMCWSMYREGILMKANDSAAVRARHVRPYFNKHWDGRHGYFYTPPKEESGYDAAICGSSVAYICFPVFEAYFEAALREHKRLVGQLLDELLPRPLIRPLSGIPSTARVTVTGTDTYMLLHIKVTFPEPRGQKNIVEEHGILPSGAQVAVRGEFTNAYLLPDKTPVPTYIEDGYTILTLGQIVGYDMFMLQ